MGVGLVVDAGGGSSWAGLRSLPPIALALILTGCSSGATTGSPDSSFHIPGFSSTSNGTPTPAAAAGNSAFNPDDCPTVDVRTGAGTLVVPGDPSDTSPTNVRYQLSFSQWARQCTAVGSTVTVKVGVQGRIVLGPTGSPGPVDIPIRPPGGASGLCSLHRFR
jgi:hypothetical protein